MKYARHDLIEAVARHCSYDLSGRLAEAMEVAAGETPSPLTLEEAATALAVALCATAPTSAKATLDHLPLALVEIRCQSGSITLDAADALGHPLLASWLSPHPARLMAEPIRSAATLAHLAPGFPMFSAVELLEVEGLIVSLVFDVLFAAPWAQVTVRYGASPAVYDCSVSKKITGNALFHVGAALRASGQPAGASLTNGAIAAAARMVH